MVDTTREAQRAVEFSFLFFFAPSKKIRQGEAEEHVKSGRVYRL